MRESILAMVNHPVEIVVFHCAKNLASTGLRPPDSPGMRIVDADNCFPVLIASVGWFEDCGRAERWVAGCIGNALCSDGGNVYRLADVVDERRDQRAFQVQALSIGSGVVLHEVLVLFGWLAG